MKPKTPNASHATPHFWRKKANRKPSSETSRPLATSSLAVGHFVAKQCSLRSPRGRLVASLLETLNMSQFQTLHQLTTELT